MQCVTLQVLVFIITFCTANGGRCPDGSFQNVQLTKKEACPILKNQLNSAIAEVLKDEAFREYLISKNITVRPEDPAFLFFNGLPLIDDYIKIYHDSSIVFELSKSFAKRLFKNRLPHSRNINPLLRKYTSCLEDYFEQFCVDNKHYKCPKNQKYRSIEGYCTCENYPKEGAAGTPFSSFLYQNYDDSMSTLRKEDRTRKHLPLVRELSTIFFDRCQNINTFLENGPSVAGAQFGVFVTQDIIALAYPRSSPSLSCCQKDYSTKLPNELLHKSCDPITIPEDDKFFGPRGITCMNFLRTQPGYDNDCVLSSREQLNVVTSFMDLSVIYGNRKVQADAVRSFAYGLLQTNSADLFREDTNGNFLLIDARSAASAVIAVFNILFIREHNRIARELRNKFPTWNDENIFQEARRWNIAIYQYIVFEWMRMFIPEQYKHLRITKLAGTKVGCATSNEFGHAIFRQHHKFISETVQLFNENGNLDEEFLLSDADTFGILRNSYANLVRSLFYQKQNYNGCHNQIRNQLFKNAAGVGMDVFSFDIKRGRDHGIQPYHKYVELCLNKKVKSFSDLKFLISDDDITQLRKVYNSVYDIDLYIGAHLEKRPKHFQFGPIGSCITNEQMFRYRHGDLFFYDNPKQRHPFTEWQLAEIRKASFSRILCNNGDISEVAKNSFLAQNDLNTVVDCASVPHVNIVY